MMVRPFSGVVRVTPGGMEGMSLVFLVIAIGREWYEEMRLGQFQSDFAA